MGSRLRLCLSHLRRTTMPSWRRWLQYKQYSRVCADPLQFSRTTLLLISTQVTAKDLDITTSSGGEDIEYMLQQQWD